MAGRDSGGRFTGGGGGGGTPIASIFALLGLKVDKGQWDQVDKQIDGAKSALVGLAAYFGGRFLGKSLIGFNSNVEDTKLQIAGMLALSKKTNLADQVGAADKLYADLQQRAASLPGTTAEYAQMLGMLTQPLTAAGVGLGALEDITVNAVVASKALGVEWQAAARDIDQALRGTFHSTDVFTGKLLGSMGYVGEAGRARFNAMSASARAAAIQAALTQKQITQLAEAQGKTFSGRLSTLQDSAQQFLGRIGMGLFKALGPVMDRLTQWIGENQEGITDFAEQIGSVLVAAFEAVGAVVDWLGEHTDVLQAGLEVLGGILTAIALKALVSWLAATLPFVLLVGALVGLVMLFKKLRERLGTAAALAITVGTAITGAFAVGKVMKFVGVVRDAIKAMLGLEVAAKAAGNASAGVGGAGASKRGLAAAIPGIGLALGGASLINDLTGGDFIDQARSKGLVGEGEDIGIPEALKRLSEAASKPARAEATTRNVTNHVTSSVTVNVPSGDPEEIGRVVGEKIDEHFNTRLGELEDGT